MMAYGLPIQEENDPVVTVVDEALKQLALASTPGAFLVDTLPISKRSVSSQSPRKYQSYIIVQYLPDWLPGNSWKQTAEIYRKTLFEMVDLPYYKAKKLMVCSFAIFQPSKLILTMAQAEGTVTPSYTVDMLQARPHVTEEEEFEIKWSAASFYGGK
jgi:hypothetical protein